ncbi:solute carrier family 22 member 8 [Galendromus occidentalis]|uniref:Solute carrier family 22 member 8 n=1 Tax=Galendromus occidentalis TaxID=34638 RepID=A0AAJ7PA08_9ACAR|nr:solute carrier family 22 member 8 [Galendromus occidentalis]
MSMPFEEVLEQVGSFGKFQYFLIFYLCFLVAPLRVIPLSVHIFTLLEPPHWCRIPELERFNFTDLEIQRLSIPRIHGSQDHFEKCEMYDYDWGKWNPLPSPKFNESSPRISCMSGYTYDFSNFYPTVVSENDWVCGDTYKNYIANSVFFASMSVGVLILGHVSDIVGRVPVMFVTYVVAGLTGITTYFSGESFELFVATRFVMGFVLLSISITPFVLAVEYVPKERRMLVLSAFRFVYPVVGVIVPWIAKASGYWRTLQLLNVIPCCIAAPLSFFIPESSRWLMSKGKLDQTKKILHKIARWNGKTLPPNALDGLELPGGDKRKQISVFAIAKYPRLRRNVLLTLFLWLNSCLVYSAGQLYAAQVTPSPFLTTSATNGVDILATAVAMPLADYWGRKPSMMMFYILSAISYFIIGLISNSFLIMFILLMIGRFALTMAYNVGYLYAAEVYPTEVRSQALSVRQAFGSLGKFFSSQIVMLAYYGPFVPLFLFGIISGTTAAMALPLPETLHQDLPETLEDGENLKGLPRSWMFGCPVNPDQEAPDSPARRRGRTLSAASAATVDSISPEN